MGVKSESPKIFFESSHDLVESESSHKNCRVTTSHWFASSRQCPVKKISHFSYIFFAMKWHRTCYKMASDKLQNGTQCCLSKFDCRLFYLSFCESSLHFTCLFHSQSFPKVSPNHAARNTPPCLLHAQYTTLTRDEHVGYLDLVLHLVAF